MPKKKESHAAPPHERMWRPFGIGAAIGAACAAASWLGVFSSWNAGVTDRFFTPIAPDPSILIVAIDDESIASVGRWPWDRKVHAELVGALTKNGARVIGYDVNFSEPQDAQNDALLADAVSGARLVLPVELRLDEKDGRSTFSADRVLRPMPAIAAAAMALGHTNMPPDADGVVRSIPVRVTDRADAETVRSFAYEIAALADRAPDLRGLDIGQRLVVRYPGAPTEAFPTISAKDVLSGNVGASVIRGKIVLVGSTAPDLHDEQIVPTSDGIPMPGVEMHASLLNTLLQQNWLAPVDPWILGLLLIAIGAAFGAIIPRMRARWSLLTAAALWIGILFAASVAFDRGLIMSAFWPTLTIALAYGGVTIERRVSAERHRRRLKGLLKRYVSPTIVDELLHHPERLRLGGERRTMTVLFSDIRGFTSIAEATGPEELVRCLNHYLSRMTDIVFAHEGVLDKYIGDAVMAFWNAPLDQTDHAKRACFAALAMRDALAELNADRAFGAHAFKIGIGIHTGDMVVGNMGGEIHSDYTVIGDSVNLASRLEGLTKAYGADIIVSEATLHAADQALFARELDRVAVKGKSKTVVIYEVLASADHVSAEDRERASAYETALGLYRSRAFSDAVRSCDTTLATFPNDIVIQKLRERAHELANNPPPEDWDGTWVWTKK